jgi:hypothetical protein
MVEPVIDAAAKHRWLDGLYVSENGKLVTLEHGLFHKQILGASRFGDQLESVLAAKVGVSNPKDKQFRAALDLLAQKACLLIVRRRWHFEGYWDIISDPVIKITAKGAFLATEKYPND